MEVGKGWWIWIVTKQQRNAYRAGLSALPSFLPTNSVVGFNAYSNLNTFSVSDAYLDIQDTFLTKQIWVMRV